MVEAHLIKGVFFPQGYVENSLGWKLKRTKTNSGKPMCYYEKFIPYKGLQVPYTLHFEPKSATEPRDCIRLYGPSIDLRSGKVTIVKLLGEWVSSEVNLNFAMMDIFSKYCEKYDKLKAKEAKALAKKK